MLFSCSFLWKVVQSGDELKFCSIFRDDNVLKFIPNRILSLSNNNIIVQFFAPPTTMETLSISASILIVLFSLPFFSDALFEYVCDEKLLYKPYVHVYKSRRGERLHDYAPGLHDVAEYKNVYICINGMYVRYP